MSSHQKADHTDVNEQSKRHRQRRIIEWIVAFAVGIAATLVSQELLGL